jgi:hypothetical protein
MYGEERLGWAVRDDRTVHFPAILHRPGCERRAVALDDRGERLLLHDVVGATSQLFIYTPAEDSLVSLAGTSGSCLLDWKLYSVSILGSDPAVHARHHTAQTKVPVVV